MAATRKDSIEPQKITSLPQPDISRLQHQLEEVLADSSSKDTIVEFLKFTIALLNGSAIALFTISEGKVRVQQQLVSKQAKSWSPDLLAVMTAATEQAFSSEKVYLVPLENTGAQIIAVPFTNPSGTSGCLSTVLLTAEQSPEIFIVILQLLSSVLALWQDKENCKSRELMLPHFAALTSALFADDEADGLTALAEAVKKVFAANQVIIGGYRQTKQMEIVALSAVVGFDRRSTTAKTIQQVLDESLLLGKVLASGDIFGAEIISPVVKEMAKSLGTAHAVCLPLFDGTNKNAGGLILLFEYPPPKLQQELHFNSVIPLMVKVLQKLLQAKPSSFRPNWLTNMDKKKRQFACIGAGLALVVLFLIPFPFRISAPCVIEPKTTRFVVAHFDGIVDSVTVHSGADIQLGDHLATLDGRQIALEIGTIKAEIKKSKKMQDVYMVSGQTASAQMSKLEYQRLEGKLQLLRSRNEQLNILSPVDGVVIRDNLEDAEGSPVSKGQTLYEIAPLSLVVAEIHILQEDISYVLSGNNTTIWLEPYPGKKWFGKIDRLQPRAEVRGNQYVFLAKSEINNKKDLLRPGMSGKVKIAAGSKPLWWICLRTPWSYFLKLTT